jgi:hypothetical protein
MSGTFGSTKKWDIYIIEEFVAQNALTFWLCWYFTASCSRLIPKIWTFGPFVYYWVQHSLITQLTFCKQKKKLIKSCCHSVPLADAPSIVSSIFCCLKTLLMVIQGSCNSLFAHLINLFWQAAIAAWLLPCSYLLFLVSATSSTKMAVYMLFPLTSLITDAGLLCCLLLLLLLLFIFLELLLHKGHRLFCETRVWSRLAMDYLFWHYFTVVRSLLVIHKLDLPTESCVIWKIQKEHFALLD